MITAADAILRIGPWGLIAARLAVLLIGALSLLTVILARWRGDSIFSWQATLLATEFGHWLAILALTAAGGSVWIWPGAMRWTACLSGLVLAAALLLPAWQASRLTEGFRVSRLFCPWIGPSGKAVKVERHIYREADDRGPAMEIVICRPLIAREPDAPALPWVMSIHGGGWCDGRPDDFLAWDRELASHGYVVAMPTYRLAPVHQWPAQREDILDAVAWMRRHGAELGIASERLTLLGRSAGGQIATACAFGSPEIGARQCIAFYAPHDLFLAREYARPDDLLDSLKLLRDYLGGDPETVEASYLSGSSIRMVTRESPRTLLIHGAPDPLVWVEQSRRLAAQMEETGAPVVYRELPWATHACDYFPWSPGGQVTLLETLRFLRSDQ